MDDGAVAKVVWQSQVMVVFVWPPRPQHEHFRLNPTDCLAVEKTKKPRIWVKFVGVGVRNERMKNPGIDANRKAS